MIGAIFEVSINLATQDRNFDYDGGCSPCVKPSRRQSISCNLLGEEETIPQVTSPSMLHRTPSFRKEDGQLGCAHYQRHCKIQAKCCRKFYVCRFCHDEAEDHKIDRYETEKMMCMSCQTVQETSNKCKNVECGEEMADYHCSICKLWDNVGNGSTNDTGNGDNTKTEVKQTIYHCDKCGLCRVRDSKKASYHCDNCNICLSETIKETHKCVSQRNQEHCPICLETYFYSRERLFFLGCGHVLHKNCLIEYAKTSSKCPVCLKSLTDSQEQKRLIQQYLADNPMPEGYEDRISEIQCNDCLKKSNVPYHFSYHACGECSSYNTTILSVSTLEDEDEYDLEDGGC